jgi:hypothetical protein
MKSCISCVAAGFTIFLVGSCIMLGYYGVYENANRFINCKSYQEGDKCVYYCYPYNQDVTYYLRPRNISCRETYRDFGRNCEFTKRNGSISTGTCLMPSDTETYLVCVEMEDSIATRKYTKNCNETIYGVGNKERIIPFTHGVIYFKSEILKMTFLVTLLLISLYSIGIAVFSSIAFLLMGVATHYYRRPTGENTPLLE